MIVIFKINGCRVKIIWQTLNIYPVVSNVTFINVVSTSTNRGHHRYRISAALAVETADSAIQKISRTLQPICNIKCGSIYWTEEHIKILYDPIHTPLELKMMSVTYLHCVIMNTSQEY